MLNLSDMILVSCWRTLDTISSLRTMAGSFEVKSLGAIDQSSMLSLGISGSSLYLCLNARAILTFQTRILDRLCLHNFCDSHWLFRCSSQTPSWAHSGLYITTHASIQPRPHDHILGHKQLRPRGKASTCPRKALASYATKTKTTCRPVHFHVRNQPYAEDFASAIGIVNFLRHPLLHHFQTSAYIRMQCKSGIVETPLSWPLSAGLEQSPQPYTRNT